MTTFISLVLLMLLAQKFILNKLNN